MRAYRGLLLNPRSENLCSFYPDGLLVVNDAGQVQALGSTETVAKRFAPKSLELIEPKPVQLILPAFTDIHLHWVQYRIRGSAPGQTLLPWLNQCVWPEEARFSEPAYAKEMAAQFFAALARSGTMAAAVYSSIHETALEAFVPWFGHLVVGNVLMTCNSPSALTQSEEEAIGLVQRWAEAQAPGAEAGKNTPPHRARLRYAVSPRFAPSCSMDVMRQAAAIAQRCGSFVQSHLSETLDEVTWVHELFPECNSYTEVYRAAGLLGPRTILGHCIYLDDEELSLLKAADACVAHCPTANEALGSGRMPIERIRNAGIRWAMGSDIGAGPSLSMLHVMKTFLRVHAAAGLRFTPAEAFFRATLAGAELLGIGDRCGNLNVGKEANFLMLEASALSESRDANEALAALLAQSELDFDSLTRRAYFQGRLIGPEPAP